MNDYERCDWYIFNDEAINYLKQQSGLKVVMFSGTWCPDCQTTCPCVLRVVEELHLPLQSILLDRTKKDAEGLTEKYHITNVPTVILEKDGKEVGRFIEYPQDTTEEDFMNWLKKL